ncbi:hypothetical protein TNCV_1444551 [Trichonephila clavipes]|nr:hypothetical protein TNCV_1444551 [Trichonephila clavipes]
MMSMPVQEKNTLLNRSTEVYAQFKADVLSVRHSCRGRHEHAVEWQKRAGAPSCWSQSLCVAASGISSRNSVKTSLKSTMRRYAHRECFKHYRLERYTNTVIDMSNKAIRGFLFALNASWNRHQHILDSPLLVPAFVKVKHFTDQI